MQRNVSRLTGRSCCLRDRSRAPCRRRGALLGMMEPHLAPVTAPSAPVVRGHAHEVPGSRRCTGHARPAGPSRCCTASRATACPCRTGGPRGSKEYEFPLWATHWRERLSEDSRSRRSSSATRSRRIVVVAASATGGACTKPRALMRGGKDGRRGAYLLPFGQSARRSLSLSPSPSPPLASFTQPKNHQNATHLADPPSSLHAKPPTTTPHLADEAPSAAYTQAPRRATSALQS